VVIEYYLSSILLKIFFNKILDKYKMGSADYSQNGTLTDQGPGVMIIGIFILFFFNILSARFERVPPSAVSEW